MSYLQWQPDNSHAQNINAMFEGMKHANKIVRDLSDLLSSDNDLQTRKGRLTPERIAVYMLMAMMGILVLTLAALCFILVAYFYFLTFKTQ